MNWPGSGFITIINYAAQSDLINPVPGDFFVINYQNYQVITSNGDQVIMNMP